MSNDIFNKASRIGFNDYVLGDMIDISEERSELDTAVLNKCLTYLDNEEYLMYVFYFRQNMTYEQMKKTLKLNTTSTIYHRMKRIRNVIRIYYNFYSKVNEEIYNKRLNKYFNKKERACIDLVVKRRKRIAIAKTLRIQYPDLSIKNNLFFINETLEKLDNYVMMGKGKVTMKRINRLVKRIEKYNRSMKRD